MGEKKKTLKYSTINISLLFGPWNTVQLILHCDLSKLMQRNIFFGIQIKIWDWTDKNDLHAGLKYWQLYRVKCHYFAVPSSFTFPPLNPCQPSWTEESWINVWSRNSITLNISLANNQNDV